MSKITAIAPVGPPSVHDSLTELRRVARSAKSRDDPALRRATPEEIQLAETQRKPWHCSGTSLRTGLPCTKPRVTGMTVCRKHGGATKHAIAKAEQRLLSVVDAVLGRLYALAMQDEHKPSAQRAASDILDRVGLGAVVQAKLRAAHRDAGNQITVNIGFLNPSPAPAPVVVRPVPETAPED